MISSSCGAKAIVTVSYLIRDRQREKERFWIWAHYVWEKRIPELLISIESGCKQRRVSYNACFLVKSLKLFFLFPKSSRKSPGIPKLSSGGHPHGRPKKIWKLELFGGRRLTSSSKHWEDVETGKSLSCGLYLSYIWDSKKYPSVIHECFRDQNDIKTVEKRFWRTLSRS